MNVLTGKSLTAKEIASRIKQVKEMQKLGDPKFREYSEVIYDDGIWRVTLEIFAVSEVTRWWVAREDSYGNFNQSLFTICRAENGQLRYSADFRIKKLVVERLLRAYELAESDIERKAVSTEKNYADFVHKVMETAFKNKGINVSSIEEQDDKYQFSMFRHRGGMCVDCFIPKSGNTDITNTLAVFYPDGMPGDEKGLPLGKNKDEWKQAVEWVAEQIGFI